mmetsp:Transcript_17097/g.51020  ORF Transcript_17097/g.51020 Transcript_17097/m.51020 type:complete len:131 (-) Transcript_17097:27-419(-)
MSARKFAAYAERHNRALHFFYDDDAQDHPGYIFGSEEAVANDRGFERARSGRAISFDFDDYEEESKGDMDGPAAQASSLVDAIERDLRTVAAKREQATGKEERDSLKSQQKRLRAKLAKAQKQLEKLRGG